MSVTRSGLNPGTGPTGVFVGRAKIFLILSQKTPEKAGSLIKAGTRHKQRCGRTYSGTEARLKAERKSSNAGSDNVGRNGWEDAHKLLMSSCQGSRLSRTETWVWSRRSSFAARGRTTGRGKSLGGGGGVGERTRRVRAWPGDNLGLREGGRQSYP